MGDHETKVLFQLRGQEHPLSLAQLCAAVGIQRGRGGRYSRAAWRTYVTISRTLQRLRRAGKVELVRGKRGGRRIARVCRG